MERGRLKNLFGTGKYARARGRKTQCLAERLSHLEGEAISVQKTYEAYGTCERKAIDNPREIPVSMTVHTEESQDIQRLEGSDG